MDHDERVHGLLVTCKDQINLVSILCKKENMNFWIQRRKILNHVTDFRQWNTIFIRFDRSILCQDLGFQTVADSTANQTPPRNPWTNQMLSFKHQF